MGFWFKRFMGIGKGKFFSHHIHPVPAKNTTIWDSRSEPRKEACQHRRAGHAGDAQQFRHERIAVKIGNRRELARVAQNNPCRKASAFCNGRSLWLESASRWGSAAARPLHQSNGCRPPQNQALPAWEESG